MASRTEIGVVYGAAVVQGLALVTFPAASSIFTSADGFGFDSTRYGALFLPQVLLAILTSAFAPRLARRWTLRRVLLAGLAGDVVSMVLLALSRLLLATPDMAFGVLLFDVAYTLPLRTLAGSADGPRPASLNSVDLPRRFWLYAAAVFVYGIVETLNCNWAMLYLSGERGVSTQGASFALAAFWVMVTVGRVLIAAISQLVPARWIYVALPALSLMVFQLAAQ